MKNNHLKSRLFQYTSNGYCLLTSSLVGHGCVSGDVNQPLVPLLNCWRESYHLINGLELCHRAWFVLSEDISQRLTYVG